jgi:hypothetical protein
LTHSKTVFQLIATNEQGLTSEPDTVSITVNAENETPSFEGILGSGKNINVQVQENSSNIAGGQSGAGNLYSDSPIFQGKSTEQDSQVISLTSNNVRQ